MFLAIVVFGFSIWEAGLKGIQESNSELSRFQNALNNGKNILFIDIDNSQEQRVNDVIASHPHMRFAGHGNATPGWLVRGQTQFQRFIKAMP